MKCHICNVEINIDKDPYFFSKEDSQELYCPHCGPWLVDDVYYNDTPLINSLDEFDMELERENDCMEYTDDEREYIECKKNYEEGLDYTPMFFDRIDMEEK